MSDVKWKLVPVEPTDEMDFAGAREVDRTNPYDRDVAANIYHAMLAAAPSPAEALPSETSGADGGDPERIWLEPRNIDNNYGPEGRLWCEDKVWPEGDEQGEPTEYIRADLALTKPASEPAGGGVREASAWIDAEAIVNSEAVLKVYTACEWADLNEDGQVWLQAVVDETRARVTASLSASHLAALEVERANGSADDSGDVAFAAGAYDRLRSSIKKEEPNV